MRKRINKEKVVKKTADIAGKTVDAVEAVADKTEEVAANIGEAVETFMNKPEVAEKTEAVKETVKETAKAVTAKRTRVSGVHLEIFETSVSVADVEKAVKKDAAEKKLKGDIKIYINAEKRAAYYTVNDEGGECQKIELRDVVSE